ncbi:hypothetical protein [Cellulosimicrobium sp. Marseille-Q4280]|uniref:hypothetical protein n=1 Tax=Cellulosimicrobium sp. Marseille-Q4280 TaxID=2937992 RepID=UPI00203D42C7|nr:hypothetical protein [Cellulosimicrobium sp. Marseille-Q4280]
MTAALAPAPDLLDNLTRLQREDLTRLLDAGNVVAYGFVGATLEVLVQVEQDAAMGPYDEPWRVEQRFWHGWHDSRRVGLAQAELAVDAMLSAGGVQVGSLPAKPEGWYGWR